MCFSQKLVEEVNDTYKIKENETLFINKSMKNLFDEIKPEIKRVSASPSINIYSKVGYFLFNFVDAKEKDSLRMLNKKPTSIRVYVKEFFDWDFNKRPKGLQFNWT